MAKAPAKKSAKAAKAASKSAEGKKKRKAKRTETFATYLYKVSRARGFPGLSCVSVSRHDVGWSFS